MLQYIPFGSLSPVSGVDPVHFRKVPPPSVTDHRRFPPFGLVAGGTTLPPPSVRGPRYNARYYVVVVSIHAPPPPLTIRVRYTAGLPLATSNKYSLSLLVLRSVSLPIVVSICSCIKNKNVNSEMAV